LLALLIGAVVLPFSRGPSQGEIVCAIPSRTATCGSR
jgi:hypothetical protein